MPQENVCRLCAEICQDYKSLCDESGNHNEVHQLMSQYFDDNSLHMVTGNNASVMCMKCWHTISDFNSFQQSIYRRQMILRIKVEEIDIKSEEEFLPEDHIASSNCEQPSDWNILAGEDATLPRCNKETMYVSSIDDTSNTDDNVEYDNPVGVFSCGKFGKKMSSSELLVQTELIADSNEASKTKKVRLKKPTRYVIASDDVIAQWMPILKCQVCTETCATFSMLKHHFRNKHPLLKCKVKCCSSNYTRRDRLEDHIRLHIDSDSFTCTLCGKKQKSRRNLAYHIRKHHPVPMGGTINSNNVPRLSATVTDIPKNIGEFKSCQAKYIKGSDDFKSQMTPPINCYLCPEKCTTFSLFHQHFSECHPEETSNSILKHFKSHAANES